MKVYWLYKREKLLPEGNPWEGVYDMAYGFIIVARNEGCARQIAQKNGGDETSYRDSWIDSKYTVCKEISKLKLKEGVIIRDFRAG